MRWHNLFPPQQSSPECSLGWKVCMCLVVCAFMADGIWVLMDECMCVVRVFLMVFYLWWTYWIWRLWSTFSLFLTVVMETAEEMKCRKLFEKDLTSTVHSNQPLLFVLWCLLSPLLCFHVIYYVKMVFMSWFCSLYCSISLTQCFRCSLHGLWASEDPHVVNPLAAETQ